jgi:hypothetical protein
MNLPDVNQQHKLRIAYLHGRLEPIMRELDRIYAPGRFFLWQMIENDKGKRLVREADALLSELAHLMGEERTPLPPFRHRTLPGNPIAWLVLQWVAGIYNAVQMIFALEAGSYALAAFNLFGVLVCTQWRLPPWRRIKQGK